MTNEAKTSDAVRPVLTDKTYAILAEDMRSVYLNRVSDVSIAAALSEQIAFRERWVAAREASDRADDSVDAAGAKNATKPHPGKYECRTILVTGESGAGKSRQIARILGAMRPARLGRDSEPYVSQQVPGPCTLLTLGRALLMTLGYPVGDNVREHLVWEHVRRQLALNDVDVLHLDEIQNLTGTANVPEGRKLLNTLRGLLIDAEHPVILVLSGLPEVTPFLCSDRQIQRRAGMHALQILGPDDVPNLAACLRKIAAKARLQVEADLGCGEGTAAQPDRVDGTVPRLIHAVQRQFGAAMELAVAAALRAARPRDNRGNPMPPEPRLTRRHFAAEYAARTGNAPFANPFEADAWHTIDTSLVGITHPAQLATHEVSLPRPSRKRSVKKGAGR